MDQQQDDAVIGVFFRRSMIVVVGLAVLIALVLLWRVQPEKPIQVDEAISQAPVQGQAIDSPDQPRFHFVDISDSSGLDFEHINGAEGERMLPETMGGGVAFIDFDNDGDQDILLVGSNYWPWDGQGRHLDQTLALYINDGTGQMQRADASVQPATDAYGMGVAIGDYDGDGSVDLFITAVGANKLFRN